MTKFLVTCTKIYNGTMFVDAENNEEALEIAQRKLNENVDCINWDFGEATADIADEDEDNHTTPQPRYKVGDYVVSECGAIYKVTNVENDKYDAENKIGDEETAITFFVDDKKYRLATDEEIKKYNNQSHPRYKVGDIVKSDNSPADKIVSVNGETYFFESGEQSDITVLDDDANFYLVQPPKYKVGDYVGDYRYGYYQITTIKDDKYVFDDGDEVPISIFDADENHHIETFHREDFLPFDKVLVRESNDVWFASFFSHITNNNEYPYFICGGSNWQQCVPFNSETAHLLGTTADYNGKYKTW